MNAREYRMEISNGKLMLSTLDLEKKEDEIFANLRFCSLNLFISRGGRGEEGPQKLLFRFLVLSLSLPKLDLLTA